MVRLVTLLAVVSVSALSETGPLWEVRSSAVIGGSLIPAFYNGYLYSASPPNNLTLFAPDGRLSVNLLLQDHGNSKVNLMAVAVDADGSLAIGWKTQSNAGIDLHTPSGDLLRTIDTGRYEPAHLAFARDHALWSFGRQRDAKDPSRSDKQDYAMVRKYATSGKEVGAYLARSLFPAGLEPGMEAWQKHALTITEDRVGIQAYSGKMGSHQEWVELDLEGNLMGRWNMDHIYEYPGVAFTSDDHAYVTGFDSETKIKHVFRLNYATGE